MKRMTIPEIRRHPWFQARLPRYLAVPPPDTMQQAKKIDEEILQEVIKMGFDRNQLVESLPNRLQNEGSLAYYLLLDNKFHVSNGYLGAEWIPGSLGHHEGMINDPVLNNNFLGDESSIIENAGVARAPNVVKFEVQLYKTRKEKYLLDLQRVHGPQFLFLDLYAASRALVVVTRRAFSETRTKGRVGE
ncbi:SNF1-related protein kinase catalytic subunit alpha KIN10 [Linum perenne]